LSDARTGVRFSEVFAVAEFRGLWVAQVLSLVGDQLARVALAVLVFSRTGSALLTGLVSALGLLSGVIGGPLLAGLADRIPQRSLMIRCDLARAALVALMAIPRLPFAFLCAMVVAVALVTAPFGAARAALLPQVMPDDRYLVASAVGNMTDQGAQVLGFAGGGGLALFVGTSPTLLVDAATFGASALVLRASLHPRPAVAPATAKTSALHSAIAGVRLVLGDCRLRLLVGLAWLCGFYVVPEGLAAPYAHGLGGGAGTVGLLMAAQPLGAIVGALLLVAFIPPAGRGEWMGPLAVLSCAPLLGCLLRPSFPVTLALWLVSGVGTAYQLTANSAFVLAVPATSRGQAFGLAQASIVTVQGATILLAGTVAQHVAPSTVVAFSGGLGAAAALALARSYRRLRRQR
jgi:hypothetical protein